MAWTFYHSFKTRLLNGNAPDLDSASVVVKISLHTATYVPAAATHDFYDDLTNEVTGTGYTAGGNEITTKTVTLNTGTVTFDAADPATWTENASGFSNGQIAVLYVDTGVDATSALIAYNDFGTSFGNSAGDLTIELAADGVFTLA